MDCIFIQIGSRKWWCAECDPEQMRLLPLNARRTCRVPFTPDEITDRLWVCRRQGEYRCGYYETKRTCKTGKCGTKELCAYLCSNACNTRPRPIEKLCGAAPGCPTGLYW